MASRSEIEAGRAFVRLFLKDDLTKALATKLKKIGESVRSAGSDVMKVGLGIAAGGTAIVAPFAAALKVFSDAGSAAVDMSARTGLSVEALSELGFAAAQTGAEMSDVEIGVKKMQAGIQDLATGNKSAIERFDRLGISLDDLLGLSPEDQFQLIGQRIAGIQDPTLRAAEAVEFFGRSGTQLLPMLGDMQRLRARARELGIVMGTEDADAADAFGDAIDELTGQFKTVIFQVGAAVAGPLSRWLNMVQPIIGRTIEWARANRRIVTTLSAVTVGAGTGLLLFGGLVTSVGGAIWALGSTLAAAGTTLSVVGGTISAIASPLGIVTALLVGGVTYWALYTESGQRAVSVVSAALSGLLAIGQQTFGGIVNAIKAGDLGLAGQIAFTGLQLAAAEGLEALRALVGDTTANIAGQLLSGDFSGAWNTALLSMSMAWDTWSESIITTFTGVARYVVNLWQRSVNAITSWLLGFAEQGSAIVDAVLGPIGSQLAKAGIKAAIGVDIGAERERSRKLNEELAKRGASNLDFGSLLSGAASQTVGVSADAMRRRLAEIDASARAKTGESAQALLDRNRTTAGAMGGEAAALRARLDQLTGAASAGARGGAPSVLSRIGDWLSGAQIPGAGATAARPLGAGIGAVATFSAAAAQAAGQMGTSAGSPQERAAKATEELRALTAEQRQLVQDGVQLIGRAVQGIDSFLAVLTYG